MKPCKACGVEKDESEFYENSKYTLKRLLVCKRCCIERQKVYNRTRKEREAVASEEEDEVPTRPAPCRLRLA